jgi:superfamily II DNA or RNA helicase
LIYVGFDFSKNKIILVTQTAEDYTELRAQRELGSIGCCELKNGMFEVPSKHVYELNTMLSKQDMAERIVVDQSFKDWRQKEKVIAPIIIRVGVLYSWIHPGQVKLPVDEIEKKTRFFLKAAVNMQKYKDGKWDGYINLYNRRERKFPTGLLDIVKSVLNEEQIPYTVELAYEERPKPQFSWKVEDGLTPDPDQLDAIQAAYEGKRGIVKAPTGFGKTAILAKRLTAAFSVPTLFVANKKTLLDDAADEFRSGIKGLKKTDVIQIKDGWFGSIRIDGSTRAVDIPKLEAPIIVATIQSLHARLVDPRTKPILLYWLHNVCKFVMVDETQAVGTTIWDEVLDECEAPYRIFLSATPRRTDGATLKIEAYSGPWLFSTTAAEQIEKGRLCELDIMYQTYDHKLFNEDDADTVYSDMYKMCIVENEERNRECILKPTFEMLAEGRHVLVLIQAIDHGHILHRMFMETGLDANDVRFVWGDTPDKIRTEAIKAFRKGDFKVMIGSTIFDAGVNIPIISGVVLGGAGNSDITLIQRIGRGARNADYEAILGYIPDFMKEGHGHKITKVYDILDMNVKFFHNQSRNRYYNAREEFGADRVHVVGGDRSMLKRQTKRAREQKKAVNQFDAQLDMLAAFAEVGGQDGNKTNSRFEL